MRFLLFNTEGHGPSGVATFCRALGECREECLIVSMNVDNEEPWFYNELTIPSEDSHDIEKLASFVVVRIGQIGGKEWTILPNVGDTAYAVSNLLKRRLKKELGIEVGILGICHSDDENQYQVLRHYASGLSGLLGVSTHIEQRLRTELPHFHGPLGRLNYPVRFRPGKNRDVNREEALRIVYLGRLDREQKRIDRLPRLVEPLLSKGVNFKLSVVGDGRDAGYLRNGLRYVSQRCDWSDYRLLGKLDSTDVHRELLDSDIIVLFSEYEGTPIALLEAMALWVCPVVMQIDSGVDEIIESGFNGVVVPQGDIEAMTREIVGLDEDRTRLARLSKKAGERIGECYSAEACLRSLDEISEMASLVLRGCEELEPRPLYEEQIEGLASLAGKRFSGMIAIYGGGLFGRKLVDACLRNGLRVEVIADGDTHKEDNMYRSIGYVVPERLPTFSLEAILVGSMSFGDEMIESLKEIYGKRNAVLPVLLRPDEIFKEEPL